MNELVDLIASIPTLQKQVQSATPGLLSQVTQNIKKKFPDGLSFGTLAEKLMKAPESLQKYQTKLAERVFGTDMDVPSASGATSQQLADVLNAGQDVGGFIDALFN